MPVAEDPHPQPPIPFGAILKNLLHTFPQGMAGNLIQLFLSEGPVKGHAGRILCRGNCGAESILQAQAVFAADIQHLQLQIPERISARQLQRGRKHVDMQLLLLNPALADPAVVSFCVLLQLARPLGKFQSHPCGGIRVCASKTKL